MIDFQSGQWVISCDDCDEQLETEKTEKEEALQVAINNGCTFTQKYHYCEQCTADHNEEDENDE